MPHRVTFVCEANICRSPLMAFSFVRGSGDLLPGDWTVTSRGTSVGGRRSPMCEVSAGLVDTEAGGSEFIAAQRSAQIAAAHLGGQDLIIVTGMAERSAVAKLNPDLRSRTFTLREAVALGREAVDAAERDDVAAAASNGRPHLKGYSAVQHRRRGLVALPQVPERAAWRRPAPNPLDIPDVHHRGAREHLSTLKTVREEALVLRVQLARFLQGQAD